MDFVHLHVHTEYSLLDGACRIAELPRLAKELGQKAIAITDHGVMYGAVDFYRACRAEGIKPIIGCEVYLTPEDRTRFDKVHEFDAVSRHLVLLCENEEGYRNLSFLVSAGFTEGFYIKPRIDIQLLREHSKGLTALSACLAGEIPRRILNGNYNEAKQYALTLNEIFGDGHFYLELQDHGIAQQIRVNDALLRIHEETGIPLAATNDAHYLRAEDAYPHDVLLCIQTGKLLRDTDRMKYEPQNFYLRSTEEMAELFSDYPDALENTSKIAEQCNLEFTFGKYHLPQFKLPDGYTAPQYLRKLCEEGFQQWYHDRPECHAQLEYELDMIEKMGFTDYFLIVSDFVQYARRMGIPVGPGRGSAAGSMAAYCLHITDVDPIKYNLYFERFLNPERVSMPDIDMDFGDTRRGEVVEYVRQLYGDDHVAQIVTFGTMAARAVIRDVGRVMDLPYAEVDQVAKLIPTTLHITLQDALRQSKPLRNLYDGNETMHKLIDTAQKLEGMPRHASTHAAGVVITKRPVVEYVPLAKNDEATVCQYTMTTLEELGLLKMDFLGLRNLTVLEDAVAMVKESDPSFDIKAIPENDEKTYEMIGMGRTLGVFQIESAGMTNVCLNLKPRDLEDITAVIALYRPGPMESIPRFVDCKHHPEKVTYLHPALEDILSVTYGCIVYQEQVIEIFRRLAGYSLGQADMVRRAISKKKAKEIEREKNAFIHGDSARGIAGCVANAIPEHIAEAIYKDIFDFANYAFNKAHAVAYAVLAYQTAYFKCHYTKEYMAALLTSVLDRSDKIAVYISECRDSGIKLLTPDINYSDAGFTVEAEGIRFGLVAIKTIGRGLIHSVVEERKRGGPYRSMQDFCERLQGSELGKRALENLILAGAFDSTGAHRSQLHQVYERVLSDTTESRRSNLEGQIGFFTSSDTRSQMTLPDVPEFTAMERMQYEKAATGLYLSGHPMDDYRSAVQEKGAVSIATLLEDNAADTPRLRDNQKIAVAGIVTARDMKTTRTNKVMAYVTIEDSGGAIELLCFSDVLEASGSHLEPGHIVFVCGRLSRRDEKLPQILCDSVQPIELLSQIPAQKHVDQPVGQRIVVKCPAIDDPVMRHIRLVLAMFPGATPMIMVMADTGKRYGARCLLHPALIEELKETLGAECVVVQ